VRALFPTRATEKKGSAPTTPRIDGGKAMTRVVSPAPSLVDARLNSPLPKIQLPGDNRLLSAFATEIAKVLKNCGLYQRGGIAMIVNEQRDGLEIITPAMLNNLVEKYLVPYRIKGIGADKITLE